MKGGVFIVYSISDFKNLIIPIIKKYKAENAILFGSHARNQATSDSDIDLIVIGGNTFDPTDIFAIAEDLYEQSGKKVDVYEINEINENTPLYFSIMKEGIRLE